MRALCLGSILPALNVVIVTLCATGGVGCGKAGGGATEAEATGATEATIEGEGEGVEGEGVEGDGSPARPLDPAFDFRFALVDPARVTNTERICVVASTHDAAPREGDGFGEAEVVRTKLVRCAHPHGAYPVLVGLDAAHATARLNPFPRRSALEPVRERRLRLRVVGTSKDAHTPLALLVESTDAPPSDDQLAQIARARRGGGCLGCDEPATDRPELPTGLDFGVIAREPERIGERGSCAVLVASEIFREEARPAPIESLPEGVVLTMPVTCNHSGGRSNATLLFTADNAEQAVNVRRGAVAHGVVAPGARLVVAHVVPPTIDED